MDYYDINTTLLLLSSIDTQPGCVLNIGWLFVLSTLALGFYCEIKMDHDCADACAVKVSLRHYYYILAVPQSSINSSRCICIKQSLDSFTVCLSFFCTPYDVCAAVERGIFIAVPVTDN